MAKTKKSQKPASSPGTFFDGARVGEVEPIVVVAVVVAVVVVVVAAVVVVVVVADETSVGCW